MLAACTEYSIAPSFSGAMHTCNAGAHSSLERKEFVNPATKQPEN
jgi:hypothetical protein